MRSIWECINDNHDPNDQERQVRRDRQQPPGPVVDAGAMYSHQRLQRGLEVVLQRHVESNGAIRWRLALGRNDVAPSDDEIAICRKAFDVPVGTEHEAVKTKSRPSKKTGKLITWHIVEMYWYEA